LEFPVCVTAEYFKEAAGKIGPLSKKCRDFIESIQPYNTPEIPDEFMVLNVNRNLGILGDWARKDRHRQLHVVASWASNANPKFRLPAGAVLEKFNVSGDGFLEHESEVATFKVSGLGPGMEVEANPNLMIDIAVDEIPKPCSDNDSLGVRLTEMIRAVTIIVNVLDRLSIAE
jgi:hypothetical protein